MKKKNSGRAPNFNRFPLFFFGSPSSSSPTQKSKAKTESDVVSKESASLALHVNRNNLKNENNVEQARKAALDEASMLLVDRLFHFLSTIPSPDAFQDEYYDQIPHSDGECDSIYTYSQYSSHYIQFSENKNVKNRGLTLPAAAIGWLAYCLYPEKKIFSSKSSNSLSNPYQTQILFDQDSDFFQHQQKYKSYPDYKNNDDSTLPSIAYSRNRNNYKHIDKLVNEKIRDKLPLLKWLLRKVTQLKVTSTAWPPDPTSSTPSKTSLKSQLVKPDPNIVSDLDMGMESDVDIDAESIADDDISFQPDDSSSISRDFSTNSSFLDPKNRSNNTQKRQRNQVMTQINKLWYELKSYPRIDMQIFPNVNILIIDSVPPTWIENINLVYNNLHLLSLERGAIFHLNDFLFPTDKQKKYLDTVTIHNESMTDSILYPDGEKNENTEIKHDEQQLLQVQNLADSKIDFDTNNNIFESYSKLTHLKLSHCAISELSGLKGLRRSRKRKQGNHQSETGKNELHISPTFLQDTFNSIKHENRQLQPPLSRLPNLQTLSLSHNEIISPNTALSGLAFLPNLTTIDLSFNYITSMRGSYMKLGNIKKLILSNNKITSVSNGLDRLYSIETLSLDRNRIENLQDVSGLANLPVLCKLDLWGNPLVENDEEGYRVNVLSLFMQARRGTDLPILDNLSVDEEELRSLESLDFGEIVQVDNLSSENFSWSGIHNVDETSTTKNLAQKNSKTNDQNCDLPPLVAIDDTDTTSASSIPTQSNFGSPLVSSNTTKTGVYGGKIRRTIKTRKAFISDILMTGDNTVVSNIKDGGYKIDSFCTIDLGNMKQDQGAINNSTSVDLGFKNESKGHAQQNFVAEEMIDLISVTNPYLAEKKKISWSEALEDAQDKFLVGESVSNSADQVQDESKSNNENMNKKVLDKSRFAFLTLHIDILDDDKSYSSDDDQDKLFSNQKPKENKKVGFTSSLDPLFPSLDDEDSGQIDEEEKGAIIEGSSNQIIEGAEQKNEFSSAEQFDISNDKTVSILNQMLEPLTTEKNASIVEDNSSNDMSKNQDYENDSDCSSIATTSTLGSLKSFTPQRNYRRKKIFFPSISSFSRNETSENISLIQQLDDDYWKDENNDSNLVDLLSNQSIPTADDIGDSKSVTKSILSDYEFDFDVAEQYASYDAPQKYAEKPVSGNLDLYFRTYVFPLTIFDADNDESNDLEHLCSIAVPRIQLCLADRGAILDKTQKFRNMTKQLLLDEIKGGERFIRFWYDKVLPCGVAATSRIETVLTKLRGFHGDNLMSGGLPMMVSESQPLIICLSDSAIYFITVKYKQKRKAFPSPSDSKSVVTMEESSEVTFLTRVTKHGEDRTYPSPLPVTSIFKDCYWPHALARHSLNYLHRITIGFGFQRLTFHFRVYDEDGLSYADYTYIVHTWNKKRTISMIQELQALQSNRKDNSFVIDNDDTLFLDSLGKAITPSSFDSVLHYQLLFQGWKKGGRNTVRRACIVTEASILLLDENYNGDGSTSDKLTKKKRSRNGSNAIGDVVLRLVDSARLDQISEVQASDLNPNALTLVIRAATFLQRNHRWRLICKEREGAENLIQYIRNGMP